jgi:preprotein translocase subunit SecG
MEIILKGLMIIQYVVCAGLILVVLLQAGKSGGIAGIFGGGGPEQIFSAPARAAIIKKITIIMACIFLVSSLALTKISTKVGMTTVLGTVGNIPR